MSIIYGIIFVISLILLCLYIGLIWKKQKNVWLLSMYISISVVNIGYTLLSLSKSVEVAIFFNKIVYLGQICLLISLLFIIWNLCGFKRKPILQGAYLFTGLLMFLLVCTTGYLPLYYKEVALTYESGAAVLVKEYGPLHNAYLFYVLILFASMIGLIITSMKRKIMPSHKTAGLLLAVIFGNIAMWIVEKLVPFNFEFLSVSYLSAEFVFLFFYWTMQDYVHASESKQVIIVANDLSHAEKLERVLASLPDGVCLSQRQTEVLECILDGKSRKEIAAELHISENTVKMHTSALYRLLNVSNKGQIHALIK